MSSTPNIQENYLHVVEFLGKSLSIFKSHCDYTHNFALEFQSLLQIGRNLQIDYAQLIESKSSNTSTNPTTSRQSCTDIYAAKRVFDDTIGDEPIERLHTIWADDNTDVSNKDSDLNEMMGQDFNADLGQQQMKNEPEDFQTFELGADETDEPVMDSPYSENLLEHYTTYTEESDKVHCAVPGCTIKKLPIVKLRMHVGKHILRGDIEAHPDLCGYCGRVGCTVGIEKRSGFGIGSTYGPKSDCRLAYKFNMNKSDPKKVIKSYPCSNRPVKCVYCLDVFWTYNLKMHYELSHLGLDCPEQISEEERSLMLK